MRVVIAGAPRCGKSTLFRKLSMSFDCSLSTDDYMALPWADVPDAIIDELVKHEDWIIEGVQACRVIRRWMRDRPEPLPMIDVCYYLQRPMVEQTKAQHAMAKAVETVWRDGVAARLVGIGTRIVREVEI